MRVVLSLTANVAVIISVWGDDMTYKEILTKEMKRQQISEPEFTKMLGFSSNSMVWRPLHKEQDMKVGRFLLFLDALGFEVVIRPKGKYRSKYKLTRESDYDSEIR